MNHSPEKSVSAETPKLRALYFTDDPSAAQWKLHPISRAFPCGLLGWVLSQAPVEAEVDPFTSRLFSDVLCLCGGVTFLSGQPGADLPTERWHRVPGGFVRSLRSSAFCVHRAGSGAALRCTREPTLLLESFSDETFSWSSQAQVLLLSQHELPPVGLSEQDVACLLEREKLPQTGWEIRSKTCALIVPGVDGDFAEFAFLNQHIRDAMLRQFELVCASFSIAWHHCSAPEFKETQWIERS